MATLLLSKIFSIKFLSFIDPLQVILYFINDISTVIVWSKYSFINDLRSKLADWWIGQNLLANLVKVKKIINYSAGSWHNYKSTARELDSGFQFIQG